MNCLRYSDFAKRGMQSVGLVIHVIPIYGFGPAYQPHLTWRTYLYAYVIKKLK